jgi:hypothetical protein
MGLKLVRWVIVVRQRIRGGIARERRVEGKAPCRAPSCASWAWRLGNGSLSRNLTTPTDAGRMSSTITRTARARFFIQIQIERTELRR